MVARAADHTDSGLARRRLGKQLLAAGLLAATALGGGCAPPRAIHHRNLAEKTRVLPWSGGDRLAVHMSAYVCYLQGPDAQVTISGPADEVDDIVVEGGVIEHSGPRSWGGWRWWRWNWDNHAIRIVVTAPQITAASIGGSGYLDLGKFNQDHLDVAVSGSGGAGASGAIKSLRVTVSGSGGARLTDLTATDMSVGVSGSGHVSATGSADTLHLMVSGSGGGDMSGLGLNSADAILSGSGWAKVAPRQSANLVVSGAGHIWLLTEPPHVTVQRSGSGSVIRLNGGH